MAVARWFVYNSDDTATIASKYFGVSNFNQTVNNTFNAFTSGAGGGPCATPCPPKANITCNVNCDTYANVKALVDAGLDGRNWNEIFTSQQNFNLLRNIVTNADLRAQSAQIFEFAPAGELKLNAEIVTVVDSVEIFNTSVVNMETYSFFSNVYTTKPDGTGTGSSIDINDYNSTSKTFVPFIAFDSVDIASGKLINTDIDFNIKIASTEVGTAFAGINFNIIVVKETTSGNFVNLGTLTNFNLGGINVPYGTINYYSYKLPSITTDMVNSLGASISTFDTTGSLDPLDYTDFVNRVETFNQEGFPKIYIAFQLAAATTTGQAWVQVTSESTNGTKPCATCDSAFKTEGSGPGGSKPCKLCSGNGATSTSTFVYA